MGRAKGWKHRETGRQVPGSKGNLKQRYRLVTGKRLIIGIQVDGNPRWLPFLDVNLNNKIN
jgi:hypothetical protein